MAGSVRMTPAIVAAILTDRKTKKEIATLLNYPSQQTKELLITLRKIGILKYENRQWSISEKLFESSEWKQLCELFSDLSVSLQIQGKILKPKRTLKQYLESGIPKDTVLNAPVSLKIPERYKEELNNNISEDTAESESVSKKIPIERENGIPQDTVEKIFKISDFIIETATGVSIRAVSWKIPFKFNKNNCRLMCGIPEDTEGSESVYIKIPFKFNKNNGRRKSGILEDTDAYFYGDGRESSVSWKIPLKSLIFNELARTSIPLNTGWDINTTYLLLIILKSIIQTYFVSLISKTAERMLVNETANGILEVTVNDFSLRVKLPLKGYGENSPPAVKKQTSEILAEREKIHKPATAGELTLRSIRERGHVKRTELDKQIDEIIQFWNSQQNLRTHKRGTKTYKRIREKLKKLLNGRWASSFEIKNGIAGKIEILRERKKKFLPHEIKAVIERYNSYAMRARDKTMLAKSLDTFLYNERTKGSWFFSLYFDSVDNPEIDDLRKYLNSDFDVVMSRVEHSLKYAGRRLKDSELAEILLPILPAKRYITEQRKKAVDYVKSLGLKNEEAWVNSAQMEFSFAQCFSKYFSKLLTEVGGDEFKLGESINRWTFTKLKDFAVEFCESAWSRLRKNVMEFGEYE